MIQATELRIGNWVEEDGYKKQFSMYDFPLSTDSINPIPLTPEILEKCGFVNDNGWYAIHLWNRNELAKCMDYDGVSINNSYFDYAITSLHQLQNLYYSLTGKELIYEP